VGLPTCHCHFAPTDTISQKLRPYFGLEWSRRGGRAPRVFDKNSMPCRRMALPQQNNCTDCGCFLLAYIEVRAQRAAPAAAAAACGACAMR
jgi:Ulp1 family protease